MNTVFAQAGKVTRARQQKIVRHSPSLMAGMAISMTNAWSLAYGADGHRRERVRPFYADGRRLRHPSHPIELAAEIASEPAQQPFDVVDLTGRAGWIALAAAQFLKDFTRGLHLDSVGHLHVGAELRAF
jgi:hypothetical protein